MNGVKPLSKSLLRLYAQTYFRASNKIDYSEFAVITAFNPLGKLLSSTQNQHRNLTFEQQLQTYDYSPIEAGSPDFKHKEDSFAIVCSLEQAIELAVAVEQNALFWVVQQKISIVPAMAEFQQIDIPAPFKDRFSLCN